MIKGGEAESGVGKIRTQKVRREDEERGMGAGEGVGVMSGRCCLSDV